MGFADAEQTFQRKIVALLRRRSLCYNRRLSISGAKTFHDGAIELFANKELYLLRNLSKGRGVGFFEAGNFHPDFIFWLILDDRQYIAFVDPKGIRNLGFSDPKIQFFQTIKDIERRLGDPSVSVFMI